MKPLHIASNVTRAHLAEVGRAILPCVALFAGTVILLEFFRPGITANAVAPQLLAAVAVAGLLLALLAPYEFTGSAQAAARRRSAATMLGLAGYALLAVAASGFAFWGAWYYFSPLPEVRGWLTAGIGLAVTMLLAACALPVPDDL